MESSFVRFTAPEARVLLVDDISSNLTVVEGLLSPYKMRLDKCVTGMESIQLAAKHQYDLILMDHQMPGMDGIEAVARIRALGAAWQEVPIVALTADAISGMREMFLSKGFDDYLPKPIEIPKLDELMNRWIPDKKKNKSGAAEQRAVGAEKIEPVFNPLMDAGVDIKRGISLTGGTETGYRNVLSSFVQDTEERIAYLSMLPPESNLTAFTAHIHALKSAAGTIGARGLSTGAALLEEAGKNRDMRAIQERLPDFHDGLQTLCDRIRLVLTAIEEARPTTAAESPAAAGSSAGSSGEAEGAGLDPRVRELLTALRSALTTEYLVEIDRLTTALERIDAGGTTKAALARISDQILLAEYPAAARIIDELIGEEP
jgi:CheY-like chemotaxis protein